MNLVGYPGNLEQNDQIIRDCHFERSEKSLALNALF